MWTPPHFWALALYRCGDYAKAGVPMMPVVAGRRETRKQILLYTMLLLPISLAPWFLGFAGPLYAAAAAVLGAVFLGHGLILWLGDTDAAARRMFRFSILYLFLVFVALLVAHAVAGG